VSRLLKFDFQESNLRILKTPEGFLKAIADIARPGVFPYLENNGKINYEAKLPEDILSEETVKSAAGVSLTIDHPKDENGNPVLVNPENAQLFTHGNVSEPEVVDGKIRVLLTALSKEAINEIESGKRELSIGFEYDLDETPGQFDGVKYDSAQRNIRINHVALVQNGRAGENIRIHGDNKQMFKYRKFDSTGDLEVSKEVLDELIALNKKIKADEGEIEALKSQIAATPLKNENADKELQKIMAQLDSALAQVEAWKQKYAKLEEEVPAMAEDMAKETMDTMEMAKSIDPEMKTDGLSPREIKLQIIGKLLPFKSGIKVDSLDPEIINARYDAACELANKIQKQKPSETTRSTGIDRSVVEDKKAQLQNLYNKGREGK
jgi:hypothetical protein